MALVVVMHGRPYGTSIGGALAQAMERGTGVWGYDPGGLPMKGEVERSRRSQCQ